jgi:anti-sigma B factor antagonist
MTINKTASGKRLEFALVGRLDTITCTQLQDVLIPAFNETSDIILDFNELEYVSSAGLRTLLVAQKTANAKSGKFAVKNVPAEIMEVFEMTGFSDILTIE